MAVETLTPPAEAFDIHESVSLIEAIGDAPSITKPDGEVIQLGYDREGELKEGGVFDAKGRVPVYVIRPGIGRGRGRHLYEAAMLQENAQKFAGWKMYIDHLSPEARRAAGGLPRSLRDSGGRLTETWWDPNVPADPVKGHEAGAVAGMSKPVPFVAELIDSDPEIVESSISASATGVHPVTRAGQRVWCVEGIQDRGSLDWVTEAGAGGRVVPIMEAAYGSEEDNEMALLESLTDDEVREKFRKERPGVLAEGAEMEITKKDLQEALAADPSTLVEALQASAEAQAFFLSLTESAIDERVEEQVGTKLEEAREQGKAEATAEARREIQVTRLDAQAAKQIAECGLPESWQGDLRGRWQIEESGDPSDALSKIEDETDDSGEVTKPASQVLREALEADIQHERDRLAVVRPTRVRDQGAKTPEGGTPQAVDPTKTNWGKLLESAHVDPAKAYGLDAAAAE